MAGWARAGQKHLVNHVDDAVIGHDVSHDHGRHFARPIRDGDSGAVVGNAKALAGQKRLERGGASGDASCCQLGVCCRRGPDRIIRRFGDGVS